MYWGSPIFAIDATPSWPIITGAVPYSVTHLAVRLLSFINWALLGLKPSKTTKNLSERLQMWTSPLSINVPTMAYKNPRSLWTNLYQRVRVSNKAGSTGTITMQLLKTVSRLMSKLIERWWLTKTCVDQNTMSVIFGLRPSSTPPTFKTRPRTCCLGFLLLNFVTAACYLIAPSLIPILGAAMCASFKLGSSMEESYLSGSLGLDGVNIWVYLHSTSVQLG